MSKKEQSSSLKSFIKDVDKYNSKTFRENEQRLRQREETDKKLEVYRKEENKRNTIQSLLVITIALLSVYALVIGAKEISEKITEEEIRIEKVNNSVSEVTKIIMENNIIENDEDLQNWLSVSSTGELGLIHSTIEAKNAIYIGAEQYSMAPGYSRHEPKFKCLGIDVESKLINLNEISKAYKIEHNGKTYKVLPLQFMTYIIIEKTENNSCKALQLIDNIYSFTGLNKEQVVGDTVGIAVTETDEGTAVNLVKDYNNIQSENISESENTNAENIESTEVTNKENIENTEFTNNSENKEMTENFKSLSDELESDELEADTHITIGDSLIVTISVFAFSFVIITLGGLLKSILEYINFK